MSEEPTIFRDVSETLKDFLEAQIPMLQNNVSYNSPADMESPGGEQRLLSLFLYRAEPNVYLRNTGFNMPDPQLLVNPPLIFDLNYLLTPYAKAREDEFDILERVARVFYDTAIMKGSVLKNRLHETGNEALRVVPSLLSLEDLYNLWSTFAKPFKISLAYQITPVHIPSLRMQASARGLRKESTYQQKAR
jgi:hypothetical protein